MKNPEAKEVRPEWKLFGLTPRYGGWPGRRNDPVGPKILMRGIPMALAVLEAIEYPRELPETARKQADPSENPFVDKSEPQERAGNRGND